MPQPYILRPIGLVHSPYTQPNGTPIQSGSDDTAATVEVDPAYTDALADLDGFERVWLLTWYDRAGPYTPAVKPFMDTRPRGLFATRAPCRPNPIALSLVKLVAVRANVLEIRGCDLLDGTPLLDIKPYAPQFDAFPGSRAGWPRKTPGASAPMAGSGKANEPPRPARPLHGTPRKHFSPQRWRLTNWAGPV